MPNFNFPKVSPGDSLASILSASYHNAIRDALKWVDAQRNRTGDGKMMPSLGDSGFVWIKNTTGTAQDAFAILGIDDTLSIGPSDNLVSFQRDKLLLGVEPSFPTHDGNFVVLLEPLANNAIGVGQIGGLCAVQVEITSGLEWYDHADITHGDTTKLTLLPAGAARVRWKDTGSGTKWALVQLGVSPGVVKRRAKLTAQLVAKGSAAGQILTTYQNGGTIGERARTITIHDGDEGFSLLTSGSLAANTQCLICWYPDTRTWNFDNAACQAETT